MTLILNLFRNFRVVRPHSSFSQILRLTLSGLSCFLHHRLDSLLLLLFNYFPYRSRIIGKKYLDQAINHRGAIFISIHAGPYPLAGKILHDLYPHHQLIAPFYHEHKFSIFPIFNRFFPHLGIKVVALGGAMAHIDPHLRQQGSVCLFLDAVLPIKHSLPVKIFGKSVPLTTGPQFLARKFRRPIIPLFVSYGHHHEIIIHVLPPLKLRSRPQLTANALAKNIEFIIRHNLTQWHVLDRFLLR